MPGYTLAPEASLTGIVAEIGAALDWLAVHGPARGIGGPTILAGWSAGAHLAALHLGHPAVSAVLAISGVYDLAPIRETYLNEKLGLTEVEIETLSPLRLAVTPKPMTIAYGSRELPALVHDARNLHALRSAAHAPGALLPVPGADHFSILDGFPPARRHPGPGRAGPSRRRPMSREGVGASLPRKEDDRLMRGRGQYVGDLRLPGLQDVAFVRSPMAHARIRAIHVPEACRDRVFTAADLDGVLPIRAVSGLPGFKVSEQPVLATGKVRQVGELVAMCVAPTRAEAEDIAASVVLDLEELPAIHDMLAAREPGSALVHEHWGDNVFLETLVDVGIESALDAPIRVSRTISTGRQCMAPIEGRGTVVQLDHRLDQLVVHTASQMPHIVRNGLSECLGIEQGRIRIVSPDVGGGFGYKAILLAEDVALAWLALRCGHPVRWLEDRREHLTANANCREHHYRITAYAERDGTLRGIDCEATVDSGAYSAYPFSACLEAAQVASILPGPYDFRPIAAARGRWRPTSARSCRTGGWRAPASASPWSSSSTPSPARRGSRPRRCARRTSCGPSRCRSTTSRRSTSTAATTRRPWPGR